MLISCHRYDSPYDPCKPFAFNLGRVISARPAQPPLNTDLDASKLTALNIDGIEQIVIVWISWDKFLTLAKAQSVD